MPLKTIVVEDIPAIREAVVYRINEHPELTVVGQFESVQDTEEYLLAGGVAEAIFLDVQLFGDYGWEILRTLRRESMTIPPVVVITAEEQKGQAQTIFREFRDEVADYILKPFEQTWTDYRDQCVRNIHTRREALRAARPKLNRLPITRGSTTAYVPVEGLTCLLIGDGGLTIHFSGDQRPYQDPYGALGKYLNDIHRDNFVRVHRKSIVNTEYVKSVRKEGTKAFACMTAGKVAEVECSAEGRKALRDRLRWG